MSAVLSSLAHCWYEQLVEKIPEQYFATYIDQSLDTATVSLFH